MPTEFMPRAERILLVEDEEFSAQLITMYLQRAGFSAITLATDGRQALEVARSASFDLILLDLDLPKLSGTEVLKRMKREGLTANTPVVIVSSLTSIEETVRCLELGADDFIPKPFNTRLLNLRVSATLDKQRMASLVRGDQAGAERELAAARALKASLTRIEVPRPGADFPVSVAVQVTPSAALGGSLLDAVAMPAATLCFAVGAASGAGVPAVLWAARARALLRSLLERTRVAGGRPPVPGELLAAVNRELCADNPLGFTSPLLLGLLAPATGDLRFAAAGHIDCWVLGSGGVQPLAAAPGPALGMRPDATFVTDSRRLDPGEGLVACTPGLLAIRDASGTQYGEARFPVRLVELAGAEPSALAEAFRQEAERDSAREPLADDAGLLAFRLLA